METETRKRTLPCQLMRTGVYVDLFKLVDNDDVVPVTEITKQHKY